MRDTILIGGIAGGIGRTIVAPIDRVKIIYQSNATLPFTWKGAFLKFREIVSEEGFLGLWRGNTSTMIRTVPYEAIKFKTYIYIKSTTSNSLIAGMVAGVCGEVTTYPIETLRTRISYRIGVEESYTTVVRRLGVSGLYRGISPAILSSMVYSGLSFYVYDYFRNTSNIFAAIAAGVISTVGCYPMEIVKRRRQIGLRLSPWDIYTNEGCGTFYKCITFNCTKSAILMIIIFEILKLNEQFKG